MTVSRAAIGQAVHQLRTQHGLTQSELGTLTGLGQTVVSRLETGDRRMDAVELVSIAEALDLSVDQLLERAVELGEDTEAQLVALRAGDEAHLPSALGWVDDMFREVERLDDLADG